MERVILTRMQFMHIYYLKQKRIILSSLNPYDRSPPYQNTFLYQTQKRLGAKS